MGKREMQQIRKTEPTRRTAPYLISRKRPRPARSTRSTRTNKGPAPRHRRVLAAVPLGGASRDLRLVACVLGTARLVRSSPLCGISAAAGQSGQGRGRRLMRPGLVVQPPTRELYVRGREVDPNWETCRAISLRSPGRARPRTFRRYLSLQTGERLR